MGSMMSNWFVFDNARKWINGTIYEGELVLGWHQRMHEYMENMMDLPQDEGRYIKDQIDLHTHFFVYALNASYEWIEESIKYEPSLKTVRREINKKFPDIKSVRNMSAHDIDYFNNEGDRQNKFIKKIGGTPNAEIDASSTISKDLGTLIGGRINVQQVLDYFNELNPKFEQFLKRPNMP